MEQDLPISLRCSCESIHGELAKPAQSLRFVCMCNDRQAWIHYLGRADLLDEFGGLEGLMCAPSRLRIHEGQEYLRCAQLREGGLLRWYCAECRTPWGECKKQAWLPFLGIQPRALVHDRKDTKSLGTIQHRIFAAFAKGEPSNCDQKVGMRAAAAIAARVFSDLVMRRARPHAFEGEQRCWLAKAQVLGLQSSSIATKG